MTWLVTSDGVTYSYDYPNGNPRKYAKGRLMEAVKPNPDEPALTFRDIYRNTSLSIGEQTVPEDLAIAGSIELGVIRDQIASVAFAGTDSLGGTKVNVVSGDYRDSLKAPASGTFKMWITEDGQLKRYERQETVSVTLQDGQKLPPSVVESVWDVNLQVNAKPDQALFKVVR